MADNDALISRRALLGAGLAAATTAAAGIGEAEHVQGWSRETDIIVVGSGASGLAAAVTAKTNQDDVLVLEKLPVPGGTTLKSGSAAWLPNNSVMRAAGVTDDETSCLRYMCRYAYPGQYSSDLPNFGVDLPSFNLLKAFYANASDAAEKLRAVGALELVEFRIPGSDIISPDYAPFLTEDKARRGRTLWARPSKDGVFGGPAMIGALTAWLAKNSVPLLTGHRVTKLVMENGRVIGVIAEHGGETLRLRARKGVIFATGGFAHNVELIHRHQPALLGSCAMPSATGDFIEIAAAAGAAMGDLSTGWRMQVVVEEAAKNSILPQGVFIPPGDAMILVNKYGNRVVDEKRDYNDRTKVHFVYDPLTVDYPNHILFMIFDQRGIDVFGGAYPIPEVAEQSSYVITGSDWSDLSRKIADRLRSLAKVIGDVALSPDFPSALSKTISRFDGFAKRGNDDDFHRGRDGHEAEWQSFFSPTRKGAEAQRNRFPNVILHPFTAAGPYYAILLGPGALDTSGGPLIDDSARVLASDGKPIPGLFGAGNCIASPTAGGYFGGGGTLGPALTFGYIAANTAHG